MEPHTYRFYEERNRERWAKQLTFERVGAAQGAKQRTSSEHQELPCGCQTVAMCGYCCGYPGPCRHPEEHFLSEAWVFYVRQKGAECSTHAESTYFGVVPTPEQAAVYRQLARRKVLDKARQALRRP